MNGLAFMHKHGQYHSHSLAHSACTFPAALLCVFITKTKMETRMILFHLLKLKQKLN